jgi:hypothetical protein
MKCEMESGIGFNKPANPDVNGTLGKRTLL